MTMDRRSFIQGAVVTALSAANPGGRSYDSKTISVRLEESQPGFTSALLTEHGDADYGIIEAFYWATLDGKRLLLHKEATAPLVQGIMVGADIALPVTSIVFLRIKELRLLTQAEFGDALKK
jgi:hypothetical protein